MSLYFPSISRVKCFWLLEERGRDVGKGMLGMATSHPNEHLWHLGGQWGLDTLENHAGQSNQIVECLLYDAEHWDTNEDGSPRMDQKRSHLATTRRCHRLCWNAWQVFLEGCPDTKKHNADALRPSLKCTVQHNTIHYNTIQHNTKQYNTIQRNAVQCSAMQYNHF